MGIFITKAKREHEPVVAQFIRNEFSRQAYNIYCSFDETPQIPWRNFIKFTLVFSNESPLIFLFQVSLFPFGVVRIQTGW